MDEAVTKQQALPCPFCGAAPKVATLGVWCDNDDCAIVGQVFSGGVHHWNRRSQPSAPRAEAVEAKDA